MGKLESNNGGKERKDYIKEALDNIGQEAQQLKRSTFVERVSANSWNYRLDTVSTYLKDIKNDYSYLNLSKDKNTTVMATQIALFKAGYMGVGHIDARWGSYTMGCIKKFQKENNLPVSGYLTRRTIEKLITVAEEKQGLAPETRGQKKQEVKKPEEKPRRPARKSPTPDQKKPTLDKKSTTSLEQNTNLSFLSLDPSKIRDAIKKFGTFDEYQNFIMKDNQGTPQGNDKYLNILGTQYVEWKEGSDKEDTLCYHYGPDFFMFGISKDGYISDGVKVSYGGDVVEQGTFTHTGELDIQEKYNPRTQKKYKTGRVDFANSEVKQLYERPDSTPRTYKYEASD